jgi:hypothetical protein
MKQKALNTRQLKFIKLIAQGETQAQAHRRAGYSCPTIEGHGANAIRLLKNERIQKELKKLRDKSFEKDSLTFNERRSFLAKVVRASPNELDANSPLVQEYSETANEHGVSKKVKIPDKLKALELDAKLAGDFNKENEVANPFLFLVNFFSPNSSPLPLPNSDVIDAEIVP